MDWCCKTLAGYSDFIPTVTWGSLSDTEIRTTWTHNECNQAVGGTSKKKCKGIEEHIPLKMLIAYA